MKSVDIKDIETIPGRKLDDNDVFCFECHSGVSCFNKCCRNLNLFLYPFDVVRLKNNLGITSDEFIDQYTDIVLRPDNFFPDVLLRMADNDERTCPFLSDEGCTVYPDRPDTCRTFPVEQGMMFDDEGKAEPVYFFRPPDFCRGQDEKKEWTIDSWADDQEAKIYNKMTILWAGLKSLFINNPWGHEGPNGNRGKIAFMAAYNTDSFRDFIFNSSFLKRYKVKPDIQKKIKKSDAELMKFGFAFIKFSIFGIQSKLLKLKK